MPRTVVARLLLVLPMFAPLTAMTCSAAMAQVGDRASSVPESAACDALCKLGRALNENDSPVQSQSGVGRGIVNKAPAQRFDRPRESSSNPDTRNDR
jgi:hypothetical protein